MYTRAYVCLCMSACACQCSACVDLQGNKDRPLPLLGQLHAKCPMLSLPSALELLGLAALHPRFPHQSTRMLT